MSDDCTGLLNAALEGRYTIERRPRDDQDCWCSICKPSRKDKNSRVFHAGFTPERTVSMVPHYGADTLLD